MGGQTIWRKPYIIVWKMLLLDSSDLSQAVSLTKRLLDYCMMIMIVSHLGLGMESETVRSNDYEIMLVPASPTSPELRVQGPRRPEDTKQSGRTLAAGR